MSPSTRPPVVRPAQALLAGALAVGVLDALDAIVFFGLRGVAPTRIFQSIAAGLLGAESYRGGYRTAVLGLVLHFTIASLIVLAGYAIGRAAPRLAARPLAAGPVYGVIVYLVMNYLVIPLSAAQAGTFRWPVLINGLLIHVLGVGIPAVLAVRAALGASPARDVRGRRPAG